MLLSCPLSCYWFSLSGIKFSFFWMASNPCQGLFSLPPISSFFMGGETILWTFWFIKITLEGLQQANSSFFVLFWLLSFSTLLTLTTTLQFGRWSWGWSYSSGALKGSSSRNRFDAVYEPAFYTNRWWMILLELWMLNGLVWIWRRKSCSEGKGYYSILIPSLLLVLSEQTLCATAMGRVAIKAGTAEVSIVYFLGSW